MKRTEVMAVYKFQIGDKSRPVDAFITLDRSIVVLKSVFSNDGWIRFLKAKN